MFKEIKACRVCGNTNLVSVFDLGEQYLTGVFPKLDEPFDLKGPVELIKCEGDGHCGLVQLRQSYDLDLMYGDNYGYRSGLNSSMVAHLQSKIADIESFVNLRRGDNVIDVGANDGTSLRAYSTEGIHRIAVDPTIKKFSEYYPRDILQIADFFPCKELEELLAGHKAKVITSFSMFYDLEDPVDFAKSVEKYLAEDGIWVFEQSYLPSMLEANSFDTICHEHLEFYALKQIEIILELADLQAVSVDLNDVNGGSISIIAAKKNANFSQNLGQLERLRAREVEESIDSLSSWAEFKERVEKQRKALSNLISAEVAAGNKVYAVGASTKGNVLLQYWQLDSSKITAILEVNPEKFGCKTPGTEIPIIDQQLIDSLDEGSVFIVLPWHFRAFFEGNPVFKARQLIFPLPEMS